MNYLCIVILCLIPFITSRPAPLTSDIIVNIDFQVDDHNNVDPADLPSTLVEGEYTWTAPNGRPYIVKYTYDDHGSRTVDSIIETTRSDYGVSLDEIIIEEAVEETMLEEAFIDERARSAGVFNIVSNAQITDEMIMIPVDVRPVDRVSMEKLVGISDEAPYTELVGEEVRGYLQDVPNVIADLIPIQTSRLGREESVLQEVTLDVDVDAVNPDETTAPTSDSTLEIELDSDIEEVEEAPVTEQNVEESDITLIAEPILEIADVEVEIEIADVEVEIEIAEVEVELAVEDEQVIAVVQIEEESALDAELDNTQTAVEDVEESISNILLVDDTITATLAEEAEVKISESDIEVEEIINEVEETAIAEEEKVCTCPDEVTEDSITEVTSATGDDER